MEVKRKFEVLWRRYVGGGDLPITFYYANEREDPSPIRSTAVPHCVIAALPLVKRGLTLFLDAKSKTCPGARKFLGLGGGLRRDFDYHVSCGIPGKFEGERLKKTPDLVSEIRKQRPIVKAPARFAVFKRWYDLKETDHPEAVIFFATPDVLAGLYSLASFDEGELNAVIAPFGAGCASVSTYPYLENQSDHPKAVLGLFDISARPRAFSGELSFAVPMRKFVKMIDNMEESFLTGDVWADVKERIQSDRDQRSLMDVVMKVNKHHD